MRPGFWWLAAPWAFSITLLGLLTVQIAVTSQRFDLIAQRQTEIIKHIDQFIDPVKQVLAQNEASRARDETVLKSVKNIEELIRSTDASTKVSLDLWREHVEAMKPKPK